jgi:hypothetical protein
VSNTSIENKDAGRYIAKFCLFLKKEKNRPVYLCIEASVQDIQRPSHGDISVFKIKGGKREPLSVMTDKGWVLLPKTDNPDEEAGRRYFYHEVESGRGFIHITLSPIGAKEMMKGNHFSIIAGTVKAHKMIHRNLEPEILADLTKGFAVEKL